jgi:hypothetical protein
MGDSPTPPPPPDYTPLAEASKAQAEASLALQREQFAWAKQAYAENKGVTDQVVEQFLETQRVNTENAAKDRARYEQTFQPLEDSLAREADEYASPERKALEIGRAQADVGQQFDAARKNAARQLEGFGINPAATRYAALDIDVRTQQAAAQSAAANQASERVDATGRALRSEAINVGRGYPGQVAGQYSTGNQAGSGAVNSGLATTASGGSTMGTAPQYGGMANQALGTWGSTLNQGYSNQMANYKAQNEASSGWGSALGLAAGIGSKFLFAADGGEVPEGGAVPMGASPTGGAAIDDVPARLTAGEFVIPKEAVNWYGQQHFYKLIAKAQQDKQRAQAETGAVPEHKTAPPQEPTFESGAPDRQALPV